MKAPVERPGHHSAGMHCRNPIRLLRKTEKGKRSKLILLECESELPRLASEREVMNHKKKGGVGKAPQAAIKKIYLRLVLSVYTRS